MLTPILSALCYSVVGQHEVVAKVSLLFFARGPFYVVRFIAFIVAYPFDCVRWRWLWSHVSVKRLKRFNPFRAYSDPTIEVIRSMRGTRESPGLYVFPSAVFRRVRHAMSVERPRLWTSTTASCSRPIIPTHDRRPAALTKALVILYTASALYAPMVKSKNRKTCLRSEMYTFVSHCENLQDRFELWLGSLAADNSLRAVCILPHEVTT